MYYFKINSLFIVFLSVILCWNSKNGTCQQIVKAKGTTFLTLNTGPYQYKEDLMNGLRNNGLGFSIEINRYLPGENIHHMFGLKLAYGSLQNRYDMSSFIAGWNLNYLLMRENRQFLYGMHFNYSGFLYENENFDSHHNYWSTHIDLGLSAVINHEINDKITASIDFSLPLISLISRPETNRQLILNEADINKFDVIKRMNSNYQFSLTGDKFFIIDSGINFHFMCKNGKLFTAGYNIYYEQTDVSSRSQFFTNTLSLSYQLSKSAK